MAVFVRILKALDSGFQLADKITAFSLGASGSTGNDTLTSLDSSVRKLEAGSARNSRGREELRERVNAVQGEEGAKGRDKWEGPAGRETVYAHRRPLSLDGRGRSPRLSPGGRRLRDGGGATVFLSAQPTRWRSLGVDCLSPSKGHGV